MPRIESQHTEWKESWCDDLLRWVSGFANAEGGRLEIGRNDKGEIVGLADAPKSLEDLPNKIRDLLGTLVAVNLHHTDGKPWLVIEVEAYPNPISYRGHCYIRSGSTLLELKGASLDRFLLRKQGRTWDGVPVPKVKTADLSAPAIQKFREMAVRSERLEPADLRVSDAALVDKLKLTEGTYLKRAALLLFHDDPEHFVTGAFVKIGCFRPASDLACHDEVHGNLFDQSARTIDLVRTKHLKAAITYRGIQRIYEACESAGTPAPTIDYKPNDLWLEFPFSAEYLKAIATTSQGDAQSGTQSVQKTSGKVVAIMKANAHTTIPEPAVAIGVTERSVERAIKTMQEQGLIRRIGPAKGGHWEVTSN